MKWTIVRGFGKVKYFNISYIVLFIVPILLELHAKAAGASTLINNSVFFPPTLLWLYAASLFYAFGIVIYQYFCPKIIKRFGNSDEYLANFHEIFVRAHPHHRQNIVLAHLDSEIDANMIIKIEKLMERIGQTIPEDRLVAQKELDTLIESLHSDAVQRFLIKEYDSKNVKPPVALWMSFVLYSLGTAILLFLLIQRSFYVLKAF